MALGSRILRLSFFPSLSKAPPSFSRAVVDASLDLPSLVMLPAPFSVCAVAVIVALAALDEDDDEAADADAATRASGEGDGVGKASDSTEIS